MDRRFKIALVVMSMVTLSVAALYSEQLSFNASPAGQPGSDASGGLGGGETNYEAVTGATIGVMRYSETPLDLPLVEASWYTKLSGDSVRCELCPHRCELEDGDIGICRSRVNKGGVLYTRTYGQVGLLVRDIGDHYVPPTLRGFKGLSWVFVGLIGCPLRCAFCFVGEMVQADPAHFDVERFTPASVIDAAKEHDAISIAFTINEPTNDFEFTLETAKLAHESGLSTVLSTSGFVNLEPLRELAPHIDAAAIGMKAFTEEAYQKYTLGDLHSVLEATKLLKEANVALEIHYIVIPTVSDDDEQIASMARWVVTNLGPETPVHFIGFRPLFKLKQLPPTSSETLSRVMATARGEGLKGVYTYVDPFQAEINKDQDPELTKARCPHCGEVIWSRRFDHGEKNETLNVKGGHCGSCGGLLPGIPSALERGLKRNGSD